MRFDVAKLIAEKATYGVDWVIEKVGDIHAIFGSTTTDPKTPQYVDFVFTKEDGTLGTGFEVGLPMSKLAEWIGEENHAKLNTEERALATLYIIRQYMMDTDDPIGLAHDWDEYEFMKYHFPEYVGIQVIEIMPLGKCFVEMIDGAGDDITIEVTQLANSGKPIAIFRGVLGLVE
tara:strand:+ start:718 stop:1242 length:525 start_codon:yes stop_codon:yes gene_type:complete